MMRGVGPDTFSVGMQAALALLVTSGAATLAVLIRVMWHRSLTQQRIAIGLGAGIAAFTTLLFGWSVVGAPALSESFGGDWRGYHDVTVQLSDELAVDARPSRWADRSAFFFVMAAAQRVVGAGAFTTVTVNAVMVGLIVLLLADIARVLLDSRASVAAAMLLAVIPGIPLWAGLPHREAMANLLVIAVAAVCVRFASDPEQGRWGLPVSSFAILMLLVTTYWTRREFAAVAVVMISLAAAVRLGRLPTVRRMCTAPLAQAGALMTLAALLVAAGERLYMVLHWFAGRSQAQFFLLHGYGSTAIGPEAPLTETSPSTLLVETPAALARAFWGPPPGAMLQTAPLTVIEAAVWWLLTPLLIVGIIHALRRRRFEVIILIVPAVFWAAISGLVLGNWGIVSRMRLTSWLLLMPIVAVGATVFYDRFIAARISGFMSRRRAGIGTTAGRPAPDG